MAEMWKNTREALDLAVKGEAKPQESWSDQSVFSAHYAVIHLSKNILLKILSGSVCHAIESGCALSSYQACIFAH